MNLKSSDCFKSWLTASLESTLTFRPTTELSSCMLKFLKNERSMNKFHVFLSSQMNNVTNRFIHLLAESLKSESQKKRKKSQKFVYGKCRHRRETRLIGSKTHTTIATIKWRFKKVQCFSKTEVFTVNIPSAVTKLVRNTKNQEVAKRTNEPVNTADGDAVRNSRKKKYTELNDMKKLKSSKRR